MAQETTSDPKEKEKEKKRGAAFPWLTRAGTPGAAGAGLDWSSPISLLRTALDALIHAPQATLLRIALGAALGIHGIWLGTSLMGGKQNSSDPKEMPFAVRGDARDAAGSATAGRSGMDGLITGFKNILAPESLIGDGSSRTDPAAEADPAAGDVASMLEEPSAGIDANKAAEEAAAAAMLAAAGGSGGPGVGRLSSSLGGGGSNAGTSASLQVPGPGGRLQGGVGGAPADRTKEASRLGAGSTRHAVGGRGAMQQLKFAREQSVGGQRASTSGQAYDAAQDAFQGQQTAGGVGAPVGGSGAGPGSAGVSPAPSITPSLPIRDPNTDLLSCESGYTLSGTRCVPIKSKEWTPYEGMVNSARYMLIAAAVLAVVGIFLLRIPGYWQIVGGALLGLSAGLVIGAVAIGNQIEDQFKQSLQREAIDNAGSEAIRGNDPTGGNLPDGIHPIYKNNVDPNLLNKK